jgi:hypothetical protein
VTQLSRTASRLAASHHATKAKMQSVLRVTAGADAAALLRGDIT